MGDQVEMVVKVHCGTVLGDEFAAMLKMRPTLHFDNHLGPVSRATSKWQIRLTVMIIENITLWPR